MKKQQKQNTIIGLGIIVIIGIIGVLLFYFGVYNSVLNFDSSTLYNTYSISSNGMIYSGIDTSRDRGVFQEIHGLNNPSFQKVTGSKDFYVLFLELNDIDSSKFNRYDGQIVSGVIQPNNVNFPQVFDESDNEYQDYCETPLGDNIQKLQSLGFSWNTDCVWEKDKWSNSELQNIASKLNCKLHGETTYLCQDNLVKNDRCESYITNYNIVGTVEYNTETPGDTYDGQIICKVDKSKIINIVPNTFTINNEQKNTNGVGINGVVEFSTQIYEDISDDNTSNNDNSNTNNQNNITCWTFDRPDVLQQAFIKDPETSDCFSTITIQNSCLTQNDYFDTEAECENARLIPVDDSIFSDKNKVFLYTFGILIVLVIIGFIYYNFFVKKKRRKKK